MGNGAKEANEEKNKAGKKAGLTDSRMRNARNLYAERTGKKKWNKI